MLASPPQGANAGASLMHTYESTKLLSQDQDRPVSDSENKRWEY